MKKPSDAAVHVEAVKSALRQTKDGVSLTLVLHPDGMPPSILTDPVGTRYMVALVRLDEDDTPIAPREKVDGERAIASAAMLCRLPEFQRWVLKVFKPKGALALSTDDSTAVWLRSYLGIQSRSELAYDRTARQKFLELRANFEQETK